MVVDIRPASSTFRKWFGCELTADELKGLFVPPGVAHGYLTLEENTDVLYHIDRIYRAGFDAGVRWNDPAFAIRWPGNPAVIHPRDASYRDFDVRYQETI